MILDKIRGFLGLKKKGDEKEIVISCERLEKNGSPFWKAGGWRNSPSSARATARFPAASTRARSRTSSPASRRCSSTSASIKTPFSITGTRFALGRPGGRDRRASRASARAAKRITANDIPRIYPPGSDIIVQVTKGPIGTKGPRITTNISLPGRYLVLMPYSDQMRHLAKRSRTRRSASACAASSTSSTCPRAWASSSARSAKARRPASSCATSMCCSSNWKTNRRRRRNRPRAEASFAGAGPDRAHRARLPHRRGGPHRGRRSRRGQPHEGPGRHYLQAVAAQDPPLHRGGADLRAVQRRQADRCGLPQAGLAAVRRLSRHRRDRGAHRHRREHRPQQGRQGPGQDDPPDQSRGGGGNRAAVPAAQSRRVDRARFHRHAQSARPEAGAQLPSRRTSSATRPRRMSCRSRSSA